MPHAIEDSLDDDEFIVREIKRAPIGLVPIVGVGILVVLILLFFTFITATRPDILQSFSAAGGNFPITLVYIGLVLTIFLAIVITAVIIQVYRNNELVITNENLIQVLQYSPFSTTVSRLSLAKVQDVSVRQKGFLSHLFNYGTLSVETAGEAANFNFRTVSEPNKAARDLLEAHDEFIENNPNTGDGF